MQLDGIDYAGLLASVDGGFTNFGPAPWRLADGAVVLRHDIDDRIDRAVQMAELDARAGIRAVFFMLDTAPYFWHAFGEMRYIQSLGHEIGWHNNALTVAIEQAGRDAARAGASLDTAIRDAVERPLAAMRAEGLHVRGTATHGDSLCGKLGYINYQVWTCFPKKNPFSYTQLDLAEFGLEYEPYGYPGYRFTDTGGRFGLADFELAPGAATPPCDALTCRDGLVPIEPRAFIARWNDRQDKPLSMLIHCQWWE